MICKECKNKDKKFAKLLKSYEALQKDLDKYEYLDVYGSKLGRITFGRKK